jgi:hypothetical protein
MNTEEKRKHRKHATAEEFTPESLVNEMLDKLPPDAWEPSKTFLDNSAGNGNFLVVILQRKLVLGHPPLQALSTIWGVELMADNVQEMKDRLLVELPHLSSEEIKKARKIIDYQIVCHNALTWDYDNWKSKNPPKVKPLF